MYFWNAFKIEQTNTQQPLRFIFIKFLQYFGKLVLISSIFMHLPVHLLLILSWNFLCADMFPFLGILQIVSDCPSVCSYPENRNHLSFVNISPTLVIDTSMERSSQVLQHGNQMFFKKFENEFWLVFWLLPKCWNHTSFVNISPIVVIIDTSIERSSRVLQIDFLFKKCLP